jgi:hypothetical protein
MIVLILVILAAICFALGFAAVSSRVNWDQGGKMFLVIALLFYLYGGTLLK